MTEIWLAFIAGIAGSAHCIGMCGSIVAAVGMRGRHGTARARIQSQLLYNLGRITTYTLLGITAGVLGSSLDLLAMRSVAFWFFCAANALVIAVGVASALRLPWLNLSSLENSTGQFLAKPLGKAFFGTSSFSSLPLGLLLGFLPCGLVYGPLVVAAGTGSPILGGAIMAAVGCGTLPVLLLFGSASTSISAAMRETMFRLAGVVVALMGFAGLWRVLAKMGHVSRFPLW